MAANKNTSSSRARQAQGRSSPQNKSLEVPASEPIEPVMPTLSNAGKSRYHHGDLRNALIDASLLLIQERGPKGFSLTEAARRAGVSAAAPYRHFQDKDSLLAAIALQGTLLLAEQLKLALDQDSKYPESGIIAGAEAYVQFARQRPTYFRCMFGADLDKTQYPELATTVQNALALAVPLLELLLGKKQEKLTQLSIITAELWAIAHGVAALVVDGAFEQIVRDVMPEQLVRGLVLRYLQGLMTEKFT